MARERAPRVSKPESREQRTRNGAPESREARVRPGPADASEVRPRKKPRNLRVVEAEPPKKKRVRAPSTVNVRASLGKLSGRLKASATRFRGAGMIALRAGSVLLAVAGAVGVGKLVQHHMTTAAGFAIDAVEVKGLGRMTRSELLAVAGIDLGTNVFARSPEEVRARLLKHPWIASASVQRRLPSRFDVEIREREPVALLVVEACPQETAVASQDPSCDDPSALYLVSDEASVFKRLEGQDPADLPVITGVDRKRLATDRESEQRLLKEAVALLTEYRGAGLFRKLPIGEIHVEPSGGFSLYVGDALTHVRLGLPPFAQKLKRMKKVFDRLEREDTSAEYVYLDNELRPDRVTVRLR